MRLRNYTRDDARLPAELKAIQRQLDDATSPTGTERARSLLQLQKQVDELVLGRSVVSTSPADLDIQAGTPNAYPSFTRAFQFPAPAGGGRVGSLTIAAELARTSSSGNITVWIELLQNDAVTWRRTGAFYLGDAISAPPGWAEVQHMNDTVQVEVPDAANARMALRLYTHTFVEGVVNARVRNTRATLQYGAPL